MQLYTCRAWGSWNWTIIFVVLSLSSFQVPHTSCMLVYMGLTPPLSLNWTSSSKKKKKVMYSQCGLWALQLYLNNDNSEIVSHTLIVNNVLQSTQNSWSTHFHGNDTPHPNLICWKKKLLLTPFTLPQFCCISSKACCIVFHVHSRLFQLWQVFFALGKCLQQLTVNSH